MHANGNHVTPDRPRAARFPGRQFLLLSLPVIVVILALAGTVANMRIGAEVERIAAAERSDLRLLGSNVTADVSLSLFQLRALSQETAAGKILDADPQHATDAFQTMFLTIASRNPIYTQIRWVDATGHERVRVVRDRQRVYAVAADALQDVSNRDYYRQAAALLAGEVYVSRFDPAPAADPDDRAARAVVHIATPLADGAGANRGILLIDVAMRHLLEALHSVSEVNTDTTYALINQQGAWQTVAARSATDGLRHTPGMRFADAYPALWQQLQQAPQGTVMRADGLWMWEQLAPEEAVRRVVLADAGNSADMPVINSSDLSLLLLAHKPARMLADLRRDNYLYLLLAAMLLIIAYTWGLLLLLRSHVQEKQSHLAIAHAHAQAVHMERLKELEERFHLLVEASSVGMVVVDAAGKIVLSNPAAESMLGYGKGELTGRSVDSLLNPEQRGPHARLRAEYLRRPEVRRMGVGRKLEALTADGRRIPVEVGLNPYTDHGRQLVLASIIGSSK
ncbi:MAG: PAS domain S-box protein [Pseudomonadota bacterium]